MACIVSPTDPNPVVGFFQFLADPIGKIVELIARLIMAAAINVYGALIEKIPTISSDDSAESVSAQTQWVVVYAAIASLIVAAVRMAMERRGEAGFTALRGLARVILVAGAGTAVVTALASLSDRYADHLFAVGAQEQLSSIACGSNGGLEKFLLLIVALLLLVAAIVHTLLLYIRLGVMVLLLGTLPLAAAASMTDWGSGWWRKHIGWLVAWLLYKPAAALVIYAGSTMTADTGTSDVHTRIAGIGVMLLSAIALPALLKLVVPATAALGTSNPMGAAAMAAPGAIASGARSLMPGLSGGMGAGASGASGASGAPSSPSSPPAAVAGAVGAVGKQAAAAADGGRPGGGGQAPAGPSGAGGGGGGGSAPGAAVGAAALGAAATVAKGAMKATAHSLDGSDGAAGHNR
ncbi:hypothetical protein [Streptomyces capillispiralis]|uniref:TrbL/VirB6 plasmid conjugal transfer protein n=1 Tax=Streptomyces capillispiralis TaxID=68182 RepID=A0A561SGV2_9ACTN|nr:hypothetical protein [Streptomyces capillispiralis]TWF74094.1 hypothetical protein FHX78_12126 [Streptomyces capillispiralis]GHE24281.1 hypothetical protein GCM10017779_71920 [Streptomyces capillispiralis]